MEWRILRIVTPITLSHLPILVNNLVKDHCLYLAAPRTVYLYTHTHTELAPTSLPLLTPPGTAVSTVTHKCLKEKDALPCLTVGNQYLPQVCETPTTKQVSVNYALESK